MIMVSFFFTVFFVNGFIVTDYNIYLQFTSTSYFLF